MIFFLDYKESMDFQNCRVPLLAYIIYIFNMDTVQEIQNFELNMLIPLDKKAANNIKRHIYNRHSLLI